MPRPLLSRWTIAALLVAAPLAYAQLVIISGGRGGRVSGEEEGGTNTPEAVNFTLEMVYPRAATGTASTGLSATNRAFFAYTGLEYSIPLEAIGGSYPYTWEVNNPPSGMTVESYTPAAGFGEAFKLVWPNPTADATNVEVCVTDSMANEDCEMFSIDEGTSGWYFLDGSNDGSGDTGTISAPFDTIAQAFNQATANKRLYIRSGTYDLDGVTRESGSDTGTNLTICEEKIRWNQASRGAVLIGYPGDTRPVIDFEYIGTGPPCDDGFSKPRITFVGAGIYVSGLEFRRSMSQALQLERASRFGVMLWDNHFTQGGISYPSGNSAEIMWKGDGTPAAQSYRDVVSSSVFDSDNLDSDAHGVMIYYAMTKPLFAGNRVQDFHDTDATGFTVKGDVSQFTIRGNRCTDLGKNCVGGNMNAANCDSHGECITGEIAYNNFNDADYACIHIADDKINHIEELFIYRNTLVCDIAIEDLGTTDGPYDFYHNAMQNDDGAGSPWAYFFDVGGITDNTRLTTDDNVTGASGVVDGDGNLIDTARLGEIGHVIP